MNLENEINIEVKSLPKNITKFHNTYRVDIRHDLEQYLTYTDNLVDAIIAKNNFLEEINIIKQNNILKHFNKEITRNCDNQAIIIASTDKNINWIVDDEDWHDLSQYNWNNKEKYANNKKLGYMHIYLKQNIVQEIKAIYPNSHLVVDHINSQFDNRKQSLRVNTSTGNNHNKNIKLENKSSKYRNVYQKILRGKIRWCGCISKEYVTYDCGTYKTEVEAAIAVKLLDEKLYKKFANKYDIPQEDIITYEESVKKNLDLYMKRKSGIEWKGVTITAKDSKFAGRISVKNQNCYLGTYDSKVECAIAYNIAKQNLGRTTGLNIISSEDLKKYESYVRIKVEANFIHFK